MFATRQAHASALHGTPSPPLKVHHHGTCTAARDDPGYLLVTFVDLLVLGPGGDEGEIAGCEVLTGFSSVGDYGAVAGGGVDYGVLFFGGVLLVSAGLERRVEERRGEGDRYTAVVVDC